MAATSKNTPVYEDDLAVSVPVKEAKQVHRVSVFLPPLEEDGSGLKVDQYEHVTINGETTLVRRGEHVEVTIPVFEQLRNKFPHI